MSLLECVTPKVGVIIWNIAEENPIDSNIFSDMNYLFDNGLAHTFNSEIKNDCPYFFQSSQYNKNLYLFAFHQKEKNLEEILSEFEKINIRLSDNIEVLIIDSSKKINNKTIQNKISRLNDSAFIVYSQ